MIVVLPNSIKRPATVTLQQDALVWVPCIRRVEEYPRMLIALSSYFKRAVTLGFLWGVTWSKLEASPLRLRPCLRPHHRQLQVESRWLATSLRELLPHSPRQYTRPWRDKPAYKGMSSFMRLLTGRGK